MNLFLKGLSTVPGVRTRELLGVGSTSTVLPDDLGLGFVAELRGRDQRPTTADSEAAEPRMIFLEVQCAAAV